MEKSSASKKRANEILLTGIVAGNVERIRQGIEMGADIERAGESGRTPLMHAVYNGKIGAARFLLESGAKIEARDDFGYTPLKIALLLGHTDIATMLFENGANLGTRDNEGNALEVGVNENLRKEVGRWMSTKRQVERLGAKSSVDEIIEGLERDLRK
ncbi:MAG: ankyrin repeat domain-containing protein [Candidatus Micrarchaeota archaeon]|nr:ankyrin repeat domain-containing protein [Candidatus Micrarchaeota archaeon]